MKRRPFGWTGLQVSVIGQGTWMIKGARDQERRALESLRLGLDLRMTHIDTAEMYGNGRAEELVGEAIEGRRDQVFLASKVLPSNASFDGTLRACERSLKRLRVDYLDLYLLHWKGRHKISETMRAMEALVTRKQIRCIGVSNFDVPDVQSAEQSLQHERLACNQVLYHLGDRGIERKLIPYCRRQEIAVVAYSPFGSGKFPSLRGKTGKVLKEVADRRQATPRQVVLNFLTRHEGVFAIPKAANPDHTRENSAALDFTLSEEDLAAIDRAFPAPNRDVPLGMI